MPCRLEVPGDRELGCGPSINIFNMRRGAGMPMVKRAFVSNKE